MSTTNILDLNNRIDKLTASYPADKVMLSDGTTSVEDALDELTALPKIKYFTVIVPVSVSTYNYSADKPADFLLPLAATSVGGGGAQIMQISATTMYFQDPLQNQGTIRILYVAT